MRKKLAYSSGTTTRVSPVAKMRPNMIVTAMLRKKGSTSSGATPSTVVAAPRKTGRARLAEASSTASRRGLPARISTSIWSTSTIAFLISMPVRLRKPRMAMNSKGAWNSSSPTATPTTASGTVSQITAVWRRPLNITITATTIAAKPKGAAAASPALASAAALCSPCHSST